MKKLQIIITALCLTGILFLSACTGETNAKDSEGNVPQTGLLIANYGREIVFESVPQKVLTLGPNCTELFCALGLAEYVIGNSLNNHSKGPLPEYGEAYAGIPELNHSSLTREGALSCGADFIYGIDWEFGPEGLDLDELESQGIRVYLNQATTLEEMYREILDLGQIFHIQERAQAYVDEQKLRIGEVMDKVSAAEPLKVLVYDSGGEGVFTCGGANFESKLISLAGGINIFEDITDKQWITVSYEEILKREPDIILIHDYDAPSLEEKLAAIKSNPALAQLECVKQQRFAVIALESVLAGGRMAYTVESLAEDFHPGLFE